MSLKQEVLEVYNTWYENNRSLIASGKWNLINKDILEHPDKDKLRGINLLIYLPNSINELIDTSLLPKLKSVMGNSGWLVPAQGRHITLLDIVPHNTNKSREELEKDSNLYKEPIKEVITNFNVPVVIELQGIFASPDGVTIQGFPTNNGLTQLRQDLRSQINTAGLANQEAKKYITNTAHIALAKFTQPLDSQKLLEVVDSLRDLPLGDFEVREIVLTISSRYDKSQTDEVVERYSLK